MNRSQSVGAVADLITNNPETVAAVVPRIEACGLTPRLFQSTSEYAESCREPQAECAVVDVTADSGRSASQALGDAPPVVAISDPASTDRIEDSAVGADAAVVSKPVDGERLEGAIREAMSISERRCAASERFVELAKLIAGLTDRERQIIEGISAGRLNKGVAADLKMSVRTVENDRARLLTKLGARTSAEAIAKYVEFRTLANLGYRVDTQGAD